MPQMKRFEFEGILLDLSYVNDRLIVLGDVLQETHITHLRSFLSLTYGQDRCRLYSLTQQVREYSIDQDLANVVHFPIIKGNPCPLMQLMEICTNIDGFLNAHDGNVVVLHSTQGKGRACHVAAAYLLHCGQSAMVPKALAMLSQQRGEGCLTLPGQVRYLHYYEKLLRSDRALLSTYRLLSVRMLTVPKFNASLVNSGCTPSLAVFLMAKESTNFQLAADGRGWFAKPVYKGKPLRTHLSRLEKAVTFDLAEANVLIRGDCCLVLSEQQEKMCQIEFNTAFIDNNFLHFEKDTIDLTHLDINHRVFRAGFAIEVEVERVGDRPDLNVVNTAETNLLWDSIDFDATALSESS
eukprot:gene3342-3665_t